MHVTRSKYSFEEYEFAYCYNIAESHELDIYDNLASANVFLFYGDIWKYIS